jgi:hypothetical protein
VSVGIAARGGHERIIQTLTKERKMINLNENVFILLLSAYE